MILLMRHAPQSASQRQSKLLAGIIITLGALLIAGVGITASDSQQAKSRAAEAATIYVPAVSYTPPKKPTEVAFLGDSFTVGTGADRKSDRWSTRLAKKRGWMELNYGYGGTNYGTGGTLKGGKPYADRLTDLIISDPDVVIVSTAGNTLEENQAPGIRATFQTLHTELPDARIIATSPYYRAEEFPVALSRLGSDIEKEVEAIGGEYLNIGHPLSARPEAMDDDGIHPNSVGYEIIADVVAEALQGS